MRNSRLTKIVTVILAAVLLVCSVAAISVAAEGANESYRVTVVSNNVSYDARMEIIYALKCDDLAENEELCLLFWETAPDVANLTAEELYESAAYRKTAFSEGETVLEVENCMLFGTNGIAASKIADTVYALPVIKSVTVSEGTPTFTYEIGAELIEYSIVDYAQEMLDADGVDIFLTNEQCNLYNALIDYANAAKKLFSAQ